MKNITKGDILTRRKGLVTHYGVYIGNDLVLDILPNQSKRGCRLVTFEEFSNGKAVSVVKCEPVDGFEDRINEVLTLGYQLLSNNCEHIANYVARNQRISKQVQAAVAGAAIGALLSKGPLWQSLLIGGVAGLALSQR